MLLQFPLPMPGRSCSVGSAQRQEYGAREYSASPYSLSTVHVRGRSILDGLGPVSQRKRVLLPPPAVNVERVKRATLLPVSRDALKIIVTDFEGFLHQYNYKGIPEVLEHRHDCVYGQVWAQEKKIQFYTLYQT